MSKNIFVVGRQVLVYDIRNVQHIKKNQFQCHFFHPGKYTELFCNLIKYMSTPLVSHDAPL